MRRNKHIALSYIKWRFFGLIAAFLSLPVLDLIIRGITYLFFSPFSLSKNGKEVTVPLESAKFIIERHWDEHLWTVFIIVALCSFITEAIVPFKKAHKIMEFVVVVPYLFAFLLGFKTLFGNTQSVYDEIFKQTSDEDTAYVFGAVSVALAFLVYAKMVAAWYVAMYVSKMYRIILQIKDHGLFRGMFVLGYGGSAQWANLLDYERREAKFNSWPDKMGHNLNEPFMGKSLFQDDLFPRPISIKDDVHLITIGMTGSGKSTVVLFPNMALYSGSIYVFDPKGELAANTFRRRCVSNFGNKERFIKGNTKKEGWQLCYVLDPYKETRDQFYYSTFNPLSIIDLEDERATEQIAAISDSCVLIPKDDKDKHWTEWANNIIQAMIVHVLSRYPKENHNLPFILDLFTGSAHTYYELPSGPTDEQLDHFDELLVDMMTNDAFGGLARQVASQISRMGENEKGSVLSTTYRSLRWVGDPAMRKQLMDTTINLSEPNRTIYIVLPDNLIKVQMRWVRVITSMFLILEKKAAKYHPTLFILDEFHQLGGSIDAITKGFPILRHHNIKLWLFLQSLSQIKSAFGDGWADIESASTFQVLGVHDIETAEWVSKKLGSRNNQFRKKDKWYKRSEVMRERIDPLLTPDEVSMELGKTSNLQIVFPTQGRPMRLERLTYKPLDYGNDMSAVGCDMQGHFEDY